MVNGPKNTVLQWYPSGQQAYENTLNITNHQRKASQNHEISPHTH